MFTVVPCITTLHLAWVQYIAIVISALFSFIISVYSCPLNVYVCLLRLFIASSCICQLHPFTVSHCIALMQNKCIGYVLLTSMHWIWLLWYFIFVQIICLQCCFASVHCTCLLCITAWSLFSVFYFGFTLNWLILVHLCIFLHCIDTFHRFTLVVIASAYIRALCQFTLVPFEYVCSGHLH